MARRDPLRVLTDISACWIDPNGSRPRLRMMRALFAAQDPDANRQDHGPAGIDSFQDCMLAISYGGSGAIIRP